MNTTHQLLAAVSTTGLLACGAVLSSEEEAPMPNYPSETVARPAESIAPKGAFELLTPQNSTLVLIDHQPQMAFGVQSIDRQQLKNNVVALAKSAAAFEVPTVLTAVASKTFSGPIWPEILEVFPDQVPVERTSMNSWDNEEFRQQVRDSGRKKILIAALWSEVCLTMPTLEMLAEGYEIYIVEDASGGTSTAAHDMAIERLTQAGAIPVTWQQVLLEWQRDWARASTYAETTGIAIEHGGAYGMGINYAHEMFGGSEAHGDDHK
ncbi:MAG: hydrolase [Planctomycetota bacterium]